MTTTADEAVHRLSPRSIAATLLPGFAGRVLPDWLGQQLHDGLGGVCLFGNNISSPTQLRELTAAILDANPHAIIAIDEEGGDVTRLYYGIGSPFPGNAVLGRLDDTTATEAVATAVGWQLRAAGCTVTFAPDVDVNSNPDNPVIGTRSFGTTPELVARHSAAWITGLQATGIAASAKHFPGHGDTAQDSHLALPVVDRSRRQLRERELVPFVAAIASGAKTIMTSHILLPQLDPDNPATLSSTMLTGLLRGELGFDGVIVSDALDMKGASGALGIPATAVRALAAGCDLLCIGTDNTAEQLARIEEEILTALDDGRLEATRVADAARRVLELADNLATERERIRVPADTAATEPHFDVDRVTASFARRPGADAWVVAAAGRFTVVRIDTLANIAVGQAAWGPFAHLLAHPDAPEAVAFAAHPLVVVTEAGSTGAGSTGTVPEAHDPVVVIGKDNHRHPFARAAIDRLRVGGREVLVIDMGWPSDDRAYADVATFGASRLVGQALLRYLQP
ncbi:glycoside hydrolase family 3 protein [Parafrigoribacterium mesophilum]|uniref:beta-N-acetylhexosaminidase n=1 Tax=Parafrigoribacterium mesophilum TaxID=433646 RepID=UPI0031FBC43C